MPGEGSAHTWPILSALAPVSAGDVDLATLLAKEPGSAPQEFELQRQAEARARPKKKKVAPKNKKK